MNRILRKFLATLLAASLMSSGCTLTSTVEETIVLETDTYISSQSSANHAALDVLNISKSTSLEERAIIKLPTGSNDLDENFDSAFDSGFLAVYLIPTLLLWAILGLNCQDQIVEADNLTSAVLTLDVSSSDETDLTGQLQLDLLTKPWWHSASWNRAHPFSGQGVWSTEGGDVDSSFSSVQNSVNSDGGVDFDITTYFKEIASDETLTHFGFLIRSSDDDLSSTALISTQASSSTTRPRLTTTYTGTCVLGNGNPFFAGPSFQGETRTVYLNPAYPTNRSGVRQFLKIPPN